MKNGKHQSKYYDKQYDKSVFTDAQQYEHFDQVTSFEDEETMDYWHDSFLGRFLIKIITKKINSF